MPSKPKKSRNLGDHQFYLFDPQKMLLIQPKKASNVHEFLVFTSHVIKTKNRNHSINKFKNLGYDR